MNKKLILTSFVVLGFACPAIATTYTSATFPDASQGQYMQADYTYTGAATSTNMAGVYENEATVYANAQYEYIDYPVSAGSYLTGVDDDTNEATIATCTTGHYCPGIAQNPTNPNRYINDEFEDDGLRNCPNGYSNSDAGSDEDTDCYRDCSLANANITFNITTDHVATLTGKDYYNTTNADTCKPATCENGYHVNNSETACVPNVITISWGHTEPDDVTANNAGTVEYGGDIHTPVKAETIKGKTFLGWVFSTTQGD